MLVAGAVQRQLLLVDALGLGLDAGSQRLQILAALASVGVDLGQMLAELLAGLRQPVGSCLGAQLQVGQLPAQLLRLVARGLELGPSPCRRLICLPALGLPLVAFLSNSLALTADIATGFLETLDMAAQC